MKSPATEICQSPNLFFKPLFLLFFISLLGVRTNAQTFDFLPEIDTYYKMNSVVRLDFQAKETREAGNPTQVEIGPSLDFFIKPLASLKKIPIFDPTESKSRLLQLFVGYRYLPSPDKPSVQRMETGFVANFPLVGNILLSDRNRFDLDWQPGHFYWYYRNRVKLQRTVHIGAYNPAPYLSAEPFYQSQYQKWATTALYAGSVFPVRKHFAFDAYYEHQNVTGKYPNEQHNQFGLIRDIYGSRREN